MSQQLPPPAAIGQTVTARTNHGEQRAQVIGIYVGSCCPYTVRYNVGGRLTTDTCSPLDFTGVSA